MTVVLIDGLWKRFEVGTSASLDAMSRRLENRRGSPMTDDEREAWRTFVDESRPLVEARSPLDRMRAMPGYRRRMRDLEVPGNRTLEEFSDAAADAAWKA